MMDLLEYQQLMRYTLIVYVCGVPPLSGVTRTEIGLFVS